MIAFLRGVLIDKQPTHTIIESGGIGYELQIPISTFEQLPAKGEPVQLLTHLYVREDLLALYGFFTLEERDLFRDLLSVSGIGPRLALTMLSNSSVEQIYKWIADGDEDALSRIKGVGKKTAQRLILDLKLRAADKVRDGGVKETAAPVKSELFEQAAAALTALGYNRKEAELLVQKAAAQLGKEASVEELIRNALRGA
ncbi:MAG: Holliday junction branch migration protein RuvA [candidate division KSB1 bacterium]|nr:Holliday junction branch migration protein RuvA [candidate division KSB1 bacterium]